MTSDPTRSARRGSRLLAYPHVTDDFSQGAIAALVPFLVLDRGWSYAAAAGMVLAFGLKVSPLLMIPAVTGVLAVAMIGHVQSPADCAVNEARTAVGRDDRISFARMSVAIICRSIVFVGMGSFNVLFMYQYRGVDGGLASASLFVFYLGGAFGTAIGGHLARRWPRTTILRRPCLLAVPVIAGMLLVPGPPAWLFIAPTDRIGLEYALFPLIVLPAVAFLVQLGMKDPHVPTEVAENEPRVGA